MNNQIQNLESSIQNEAEPDRADVAHSAHARFTTKARTERIFAARSFRTGNNVHSYLIKGKWAKVGKGGQNAGKWTGFSHFETAFSRLFPHVSTQVVDFPHICSVRVFWEAVKWAATDETRIGKRLCTEGNRAKGAKRSLEQYWKGEWEMSRVKACFETLGFVPLLRLALRAQSRSGEAPLPRAGLFVAGKHGHEMGVLLSSELGFDRVNFL